MSSKFSFEKFAYQPDPEFDDYTFVKFEELKDKVIIFGDNCRIKDDSVKFSFMYADDDSTDVFCTFTKSKAIVNTLKNIMESEGLIPKVAVKISTYSTGKGNDGYCFKDVE